MNPVNHVAIIMDGNGRWGLKHKSSRNAGHKFGLKTVESIIKASIKSKIKFLTLYAFSTENWKRPKNEIKYLFNLSENFLTNKVEKLNQSIGIHIGSVPITKEVLNLYIEKYTIIESNKYPGIEIKKAIFKNLILFLQKYKYKNKNITPT